MAVITLYFDEEISVLGFSCTTYTVKRTRFNVKFITSYTTCTHWEIRRDYFLCLRNGSSLNPPR